MTKPQCIRGLKKFKAGCPQRGWNGTDGCVAWIEKEKVPQRDGTISDVKECLDLWMFRLAWAQVGATEGSQAAVESFRNGMCEPGPDGGVQPKSARFVLDIRGGVPILAPRENLAKQIAGKDGDNGNRL